MKRCHTCGKEKLELYTVYIYGPTDQLKPIYEAEVCHECSQGIRGWEAPNGHR